MVSPQLPLIHCQRSIALSNAKSSNTVEVKTVEPVLSFWQKLLVNSRLTNKDKYVSHF